MKNVKLIISIILVLLLAAVNIILCSSALAADPVTVNIPVYKLVDGDPSTDETFTFELSADSDEPMPSGYSGGTKTITIDGEGSAYFGEITYYEPGDYLYEIYEIAGSNERYEYDDMVYNLTVQVTWTDESYEDLQAIMYITDSEGEEKYESMVFENTYNYSSVSVDPPVSKYISGDSPSVKSEFVFYLRADDVDYPMPPGSVNGVKTLTITGAETKDFGYLTYTEPGVYTYTVYESDDNLSGYEYDPVVYTMTVTVTESDGVLTAVREIVDDTGASASGLVFTNTFTEADTPKTGDDSLLFVCWIILGLAALGMGIALFVKYIQDKKDGEPEK